VAMGVALQDNSSNSPPSNHNVRLKEVNPIEMTPNFCYSAKALMGLILVISALLPMQDGEAGPMASNYWHSIQSAAANGYSVNRNESCEDLSTGKY